MTGPKLNERPGTRATLRGYHMSASKARVVLNLIRNEDVTTAQEILAGTTREAAAVISKVLASAIATPSPTTRCSPKSSTSRPPTRTRASR